MRDYEPFSQMPAPTLRALSPHDKIGHIFSTRCTFYLKNQYDNIFLVSDSRYSTSIHAGR
jgi:hypothetical protein